MKKLCLLSFCLLFFSSCIALPGQILQSTSQFDGSSQIQIEPAWLPYSAIKLALFKNTKMKADEVVLTVVIQGAYIFSRGNSLLFNIDGDIISFQSLDTFTDIKTSPGYYGYGTYLPPSNWSSKDYLIDTAFVKRIVEANRVIVKVNLNKESVEGVFSHDGFSLARPAFRKFYAQMAKM